MENILAGGKMNAVVVLWEPLILDIILLNATKTSFSGTEIIGCRTTCTFTNNNFCQEDLST